MDQLPAVRTDPLMLSQDRLLVVSFAKSSSPHYVLAVNIAQGASGYEAIPIGKHIVHWCVFEKNRAEASRAIALLDYVSAWNGTQVFAAGRLLDSTARAMEVLRCYVKALSCHDFRANCHIVSDHLTRREILGGVSITLRANEADVEFDKIPQILYPCAFLRPYHTIIKPDHPSTIVDQIQAAGINRGCDWCPYFDPQQFRELPHR